MRLANNPTAAPVLLLSSEASEWPGGSVCVTVSEGLKPGNTEQDYHMGGESSVPVTLLRPAHVVPVRPARVVLDGYSVAIADSRIVALGPDLQMVQAYPDAQTVDLPNHVLLPGLINMHTHSPMTLLRGYADDLSLQSWLGRDGSFVRVPGTSSCSRTLFLRRFWLNWHFY